FDTRLASRRRRDSVSRLLHSFLLPAHRLSDKELQAHSIHLSSDEYICGLAAEREHSYRRLPLRQPSVASLQLPTTAPANRREVSERASGVLRQEAWTVETRRLVSLAQGKD